MDNFLDLGHHERVYRIKAHYRRNNWRLVGFTVIVLLTWFLAEKLAAPTVLHGHDLLQLCRMMGG